jgi:hypothetical protein
VVRDVERRLEAMTVAGGTISERALSKLKVILERAKRLQKQKKDDKNKLYAMHAPEVECIAKGKARKPYEFGVKMATAVAHEVSLIIGARTFAGNPFDGHILSAALEQSTNLMQDHSVKTKEVIADLGYRGLSVDGYSVIINARIRRCASFWMPPVKKSPGGRLYGYRIFKQTDALIGPNMGRIPVDERAMSKRKTDVIENFGERLATNSLEHRLLEIEKLDPKAKRQITQLLDTFIERAKLKQRVNAQGA